MNGKLPKINKSAHDYVEKIIASERFQERMKRMRVRHGIPEDGFPISMFDELVVAEQNPRIADGVLDIKKYEADVKQLLHDLGLSFTWFSMMSDYVQFAFFGAGIPNQIVVLDIGRTNRNPVATLAAIKNFSVANPVALLLPPYASARDIADFIATRSNTIKNIQDRYRVKKIKLGKMRRKNARIATRDQFVLKNSELPKRELMRLVKDRFGDLLDYSHLNKIIASERKKKSAGI